MRMLSKFIVLSITVFISASCARPQANAPGPAMPAGNVAAPRSSPTPEPAVQANADPKTLALALYEFYVDGYPRIEDEGPAFSKYLTSRFFKEASKADDYDPFLDAQDVDETWKGNVSAADAVTKGDKSTVDVLLNGKTFKWTMRVSLLKQKDAWKIDGIKQTK